MPLFSYGRGIICVILSAMACARPSHESKARADIGAVLARGVEATRTRDINTYMALIPEDAVLRDGAGNTLSRDVLRTNTLRDWSIIPATLAISVTIDSLEVNGDSAIVHTAQEWKRLMLQRDGLTTDTVLTTQRHREVWRWTTRGWFAYEIEELGGEVFINGKAFEPGG